MLRSLVGRGPAIPAGGVASQSGGGVGLRGVAAVAGIAFLMVFAGVALSGCLEDGDSSDDSDIEFDDELTVKSVTGPHTLSLSGDQSLSGALYMDGVLYHVYRDGDSFMMHNNDTGEITTIYDSVGNGVFGRGDVSGDTAAYNYKEADAGGVQYRHRVMYENLSTGEKRQIAGTDSTAPDAEEDQYITLASAVSTVAYFWTNDDGTWDLILRDLYQNHHIVDIDLVVDRLLSGDADMSGEIIGYVDQSERLRIYKSEGWGTVHVKVVEMDAKYVSFSEGLIGVVDDEGLKMSTYDDPVNFTLVPGTEGADAVSLLGEYKLLSKGTDLFLFDEDNRSAIIYDGQVTDIWLEESEGLFSASGTYQTPETDGDDIGHLNFELVSEEA